MTEEKKISEIEGLGKSDRPDQTAKIFTYRRPAELKRNRSIIPLVRSDIMIGVIQIFQKGGEQSLHSHAALDGFWFVLGGRARFYGEGDELLAELGPHDGIFIPRNFLYWFEAAGDEPLQILQLEAIDKSVANTIARPAPPPDNWIDVISPTGEVIAENVKLHV